MQSRTGQSGVPSFSSPSGTQKDISEQFEEKMQDIRGQELERRAHAEALQNGLPYINLFGFPISQEAISLIPEERARQLQIVCFYFSLDEFRLGSTRPADPDVQQLLYELGERHHATGAIYYISEKSFQAAYALYKKVPKVADIRHEVVISEKDLERWVTEINDLSSLGARLKDTSITDFISLLLAAALRFEASDVHLEAEESGIAVRFRVDGVLQDIVTLHQALLPKIISRIKLFSGLKINITDRPQDGRFTITKQQEKIDVRVSILPTVHGESIVLRILRPSTVGISFEELGLRGEALTILSEEIQRPNGMIITTGPTGSGKTTTLYALIKEINTAEIKIVTLEDPVEYKVEGINQSQIDPSKEYTFAKGLKSLLRQDPDVVMVGEIRDFETADIAIQAALTGHLIFSTIHTNSAVGAIPRFLALGVKLFLLAPALNVVIGQRLVRRVCTHCVASVAISSEVAVQVQGYIAEIPESKRGPGVHSWDGKTLMQGAGCSVCNGTGYKGRIGIFEVFRITDEVEKAVLSGESGEYQMRALTESQGMLTMFQDGVLKVIDGLTTLDEISRVAEV